MIYENIIGLCWLTFGLYWIISSFGIKKDIHREGEFGSNTYGSRFGSIFLIAFFIIIFSDIPGVAGYLKRFDGQWVISYPWIGILGVACAVCGIGYAIWARVHLGRNWSPAPAIKEEHELVTSGPYRSIRHPIYTGILLALCGSVLVGGISWCIGLISALCVFVWRVKKEEGFMMKLFPNQYPEYKKRTNALIPYIW